MAVLVLAASWPVTTRAGFNYALTTQRIPLYEKTINFISRDLQTRRIAHTVVAGAATDDEQLLRIFDWVAEHVRPTPEGLPIIDDHPLHILIRGYGASDQRTEAFLLLAGYSGHPGVSAALWPKGAPRSHLVAVVQTGRRALPFDVVNGIVFRDARGALADVPTVLAHPDLVDAAAPGLTIDGLPYRRYIQELGRAGVFSRTASQRVWSRIKEEAGRLVGIRRHPPHLTGFSVGDNMQRSSTSQ